MNPWLLPCEGRSGPFVDLGKRSEIISDQVFYPFSISRRFAAFSALSRTNRGQESRDAQRRSPALLPSQHSPVPHRHRHIPGDFWPGTLPACATKSRPGLALTSVCWSTMAISLPQRTRGVTQTDCGVQAHPASHTTRNPAPQMKGMPSASGAHGPDVGAIGPPLAHPGQCRSLGPSAGDPHPSCHPGRSAR